MAVTKANATAGQAKVEPVETSGVAPATEFSTSGAPRQIVPDVDPDHPAVDNDPRANTTAEMNRIDFNDPIKGGAEIAAEQAAPAQTNKA